MISILCSYHDNSRQADTGNSLQILGNGSPSLIKINANYSPQEYNFPEPVKQKHDAGPTSGRVLQHIEVSSSPARFRQDVQDYEKSFQHISRMSSPQRQHSETFRPSEYDQASFFDYSSCIFIDLKL